MSIIDSTAQTLTATAHPEKSEDSANQEQRARAFVLEVALVLFVLGAFVWVQWELHHAAERGRVAQEAR